MLYNYKLGTKIASIPTIGFNVETLEFNKTSLTVWDIGGQPRIRLLWRHYFADVHGLIFVIDASDPTRFDEAKEELFKLHDQA